MTALSRWKHLSGEWAVLSYYQRFESTVALVLTLIIGLIVLVALYRLTIWPRQRGRTRRDYRDAQARAGHSRPGHALRPA